MGGMWRARPGSGPSLRRTKRASGGAPLILLPLLAAVAVFGPAAAARGMPVQAYPPGHLSAPTASRPPSRPASAR